MKKLGFGAMRLPQIEADGQRVIDMETTKKMFDAYLAAGFTYFDTAYMYHGGKSETTLRELVVKRYPRDAFTITDKLPLSGKPGADELEGIFNEQLARCGVDYFDYYWLHSVNRQNYEHAEKVGAFGFIQQKKAEGKTKHIGFSYHDTAELLDEILTAHPEVEYVQLQINYLDWEDEKIQSRKCYEVCVKHQKPVIVMEPIKGGRLAGLPEEAERLLKAKEPESSIASWAVRYAASLENVMVVLSGMSTPEQVADNVAYMQDFQPLNEEEYALVEQAAEITRRSITIGCTSCRYCTDGCPQSIPIPSLFTVYNDYRRFAALGKAQYVTEYKWATDKAGKASDCIGCRQCEEHCPQHLEITEWLKTIAETFE